MEKPSEVRLCKCHAEPMYRSSGRPGSESWRCAVRHREQQRKYRETHKERWTGALRARYAADPEYRERRQRQHQDWYEGGGWATVRRRHLKAQRVRITEQLMQLEQEAASC